MSTAVNTAGPDREVATQALNRELQDKNVHVVLQSNDVVGGPVSNGVVFATRRFVDANPKLAKVFVSALDEAMTMIRNEPLRAADIYLSMTKERFSVVSICHRMRPFRMSSAQAVPSRVVR